MPKFFFLRDALNACDSDQIIIAEDKSSAGNKQFYVDSVLSLSVLYSSLINRHWYECLQENRPTRFFLDVESTSKVDIDSLLKYCSVAIQYFLKANGRTAAPQFQVLDSCSSTKVSYHIICTNFYLHNVYHVGAFVRRLVLTMIHNGQDSSAIDTAVYTKNRMFRVNGSTKFGSERRLKHTLSWTQLLVQSPLPTLDVLHCNEIDESTPVSTSSHPSSLFQISDTGQWIASTNINYKATLEESTSTCCLLFDPILNWLDSNLEAETNRYEYKLKGNGHFMVQSGSKVCQISKREHKGNHIWFRFDTVKQHVYQHCYDSDCKRREPIRIEIPSSCWDQWNKAWNETVPYIEE